jgi:hypothetical protein
LQLFDLMFPAAGVLKAFFGEYRKRTMEHTLPSLDQAGYDEAVLEWIRSAA